MPRRPSRQATTDPVFPAGVIETLSIDNLVFGLQDGELKILLIRHKDGISVGKWALPGGWVLRDEDLDSAAARLLNELTGVHDLYLEQLKAFGRVDRFPRGRVVTVAYYALVSAEAYEIVAGNNASEASWFGVGEVPELIYDHREILDFGIAQLRHKVRHEPIGFNLLPERFTLLQLQELYEAILDTKLDKPNFRRKILRMNLLISCAEKQQGVAHRAAKLYRFEQSVYERLAEDGFSFGI